MFGVTQFSDISKRTVSYSFAFRNLVEAANVLSTNRSAIQLRYLQTLTHIAAQHNHTIVIPVSMEILKKVLGKFTNFASPAKVKV